ncbi:response regulator transcription factor [Streptomyces flavidovirens]|uniref:response regulator transcription factor n=1 Tax=Streptomyces flavidovirens TaxID=67298 RepID=UPI0004055BDE|nr:response regulator transcription factor [Streptomyces flavidovirens]
MSPAEPVILIAEDEPSIASFLRKGLRAHGFVTTVVSDGRRAHDEALTGAYDLLILDVGLPGKSGFTVLSELRAARSCLPVIILTARDSVEDTVAGLEGGANDYMAKPFRFEELLARVRLRLREVDDDYVLRRGAVALDLRTRQAHVDGRTVGLSARESLLLETLMRDCGRVLPRERLLATVWGNDAEEGSNVVEVYVRYLRRKLGADRITTVRGRGYRLGDPAEEEAPGRPAGPVRP